MNQQQLQLAVNTGLELLGPKSGLSLPVSLNDGVFFLKQLLLELASGKLGVSPVLQRDIAPPKAPTGDEGKGDTGKAESASGSGNAEPNPGTPPE